MEAAWWFLKVVGERTSANVLTYAFLVALDDHTVPDLGLLVGHSALSRRVKRGAGQKTYIFTAEKRQTNKANSPLKNLFSKFAS